MEHAALHARAAPSLIIKSASPVLLTAQPAPIPRLAHNAVPLIYCLIPRASMPALPLPSRPPTARVRPAVRIAITVLIPQPATRVIKISSFPIQLAFQAAPAPPLD